MTGFHTFATPGEFLKIAQAHETKGRALTVKTRCQRVLKG